MHGTLMKCQKSDVMYKLFILINNNFYFMCCFFIMLRTQFVGMIFRICS